MGNNAVDLIAKASLDRYSKPSEREVLEWHCEVAFLKNVLVYLPAALSQWPAVNPTAGKKVLPKRADLQTAPEAKVSFLSDALGPLRRAAASLDPLPASPPELGTRAAASSSAVPPPPPPRPKSGPLGRSLGNTSGPRAPDTGGGGFVSFALVPLGPFCPTRWVAPASAWK